MLFGKVSKAHAMKVATWAAVVAAVALASSPANAYYVCMYQCSAGSFYVDDLSACQNCVSSMLKGAHAPTLPAVEREQLPRGQQPAQEATSLP